MRVENRPKPPGGRGLAYHAAEVRYGLSLVRSALAWRADALLVDSGTTHWWLLALLRPAGLPIVPVLHNSLWPEGYPPRRLARRLLLALDRLFWRHSARTVLHVSPACERQVRSLCGARPPRFIHFRAQFDGAQFRAAPPAAGARLRVVFAGRIERDKGVFDVVRAARLLERSHPGRVQFRFCGEGSRLGELREAVRRAGLDSSVAVLGRLDRPALLNEYAAAHLAIVPTRSEFAEGYATVCAEAVLCGRPVLTCPVVPAAEELDAAVLLARPDDPASYARQIAALLDDPARYARLCAACAALRERLLDPRASFLCALEALDLAAGGHAPRNEHRSSETSASSGRQATVSPSHEAKA